MPLHLAMALALLMLIVGMGLSWSHFHDVLVTQEATIEDLEIDLEQALEDKADATNRALAAEQSLELVLGEADRDPLTAPVQVIRGAL